jgi:hypothetical protein
MQGWEEEEGLAKVLNSQKHKECKRVLERDF